MAYDHKNSSRVEFVYLPGSFLKPKEKSKQQVRVRAAELRPFYPPLFGGVAIKASNLVAISPRSILTAGTELHVAIKVAQIA